jgi:outer membrane protein
MNRVRVGIRAAVPLALGTLALLVSSEARGQFANHSIGFAAGYAVIDPQVRAGSGLVLGVESTLYLEAGFDLYFRVLAGIHKDLVSDTNAVGFFPGIGIRYLFSEDFVRPYVGVGLAFMHFFASANLPSALFAASPFLGIEYFFDNNAAVGIQGEYQRILVLNGPGGNAFAGFARVAWSF